jgi:hypothetical protein
MSFKIYTKSKISFEVDGETITLHVNRLSAKKEMLFSLKVARLQDQMQENNVEATAEIFELYAHLLGDITYEVDGVDREDLPDGRWPEDKDARVALFEDAGIEFLQAAMTAYNETKAVKTAKKS